MLVYFNKLEYYWKIQNWFVKRNKNGTIAHLVVQLMFEDSCNWHLQTITQMYNCSTPTFLESYGFLLSLCLHLTWYT